MDLVSVEKISGGWYVRDHTGEILIGYRNKKNAEDFAKGHACSIYGEAERYNERRDYALTYLASRAKRLPVIAAQFELF
jgi:hypothetical protein